MPKRNTKRVKLQDLFRWKKELPIFGPGGEEVIAVWQRVVSDKQYEEARLQALRRSREIRMALRDESTAEYAALMENLETATDDQLVSVIITGQLGKLYESADKEVSMQMPKHPGPDASLEDLEEYEATIDSYNEDRSQAILEVVDVRMKAKQEKLLGLSREAFLEQSRLAFENQICNNVVNEVLLHYTTYLGTYSDERCGVRYFVSFNDYEEVATEIKEQLTKGYNQLKLGPEELKN